MAPVYPIAEEGIRDSLPCTGVNRWMVFVFFSNNLGCLGSLIVSLVGTLALLLVLGVIRIG
jgi:hypothetical protein